MPLPPVPTDVTGTPAHQRRVAETLNALSELVGDPLTVGRFASLPVALAFAKSQRRSVVLTVDQDCILDQPLSVDRHITLRIETGIITLKAGVVLTINGHIQAPATRIFDATAPGSRVTGALQNEFLYTEWWGALGDGVNDDTQAMQSAALAAQEAGYIGIRLLARTYRVTDTLHGNGRDAPDFDAPSWRGVDKKRTVIDGSSFRSAKPILKFRGGAGQFSGAVVQDIEFRGSREYGSGISFSGKCGMRAVRCRFDSLKLGVDWHNEDPGAFTEYCTADDCEFTYEVEVKGRYRRGEGNDSFHGSGFRDRCTFAHRSSTAIRVESGAKPYNAPLDLQIWLNGNCTLIGNESTQPNSFVGNLTIESFGDNALVLATGRPVIFVGWIANIAQHTSDGSLLQCRAVTLNTDSSVAPIGWRKSHVQDVSTGDNRLESAVPTSNRLTFITFTASGFDARYRLSVAPSNTGGKGDVVILAEHRLVDSPGFGPVRFTVRRDGHLIAINDRWPMQGVTAYWHEESDEPGSPYSHWQRI